MTFAEKQAQLAKAMDAKLKELSKGKVLKADQNRDKQTDEERTEIKEYFLALASGNKNGEHTKANDIIKQSYEAHGIEWRDEGEIRAKAQTVGTAGQGGVLVPVTLRTNIIEKLRYISPMRQIATVLNDMPAILDMPYDNALPTTYWVGEGAAITPSGATFAKKQLVPYKLAGLDPFSYESLVDTAVSPDLQRLVEDRFAIALALAENAAFVNGDGSSKPFGFRSSDITPTVITGNTTAGNLAYTDVTNLMFNGVPTAYRNVGHFITSSKGVQLLLNMKDTQGRPLYLPGQTGLANASYDTFLNRPIHVVDEIPTNLGAGTNETQLWFCVPSMYWIGNRGALRTDYGTNGTDFAQDQITLRMIERVAGRPFLDEAWSSMNIK
jgi:HK97 family phage major capsid protein